MLLYKAIGARAALRKFPTVRRIPWNGHVCQPISRTGHKRHIIVESNTCQTLRAFFNGPPLNYPLRRHRGSPNH